MTRLQNYGNCVSRLTLYSKITVVTPFVDTFLTLDSFSTALTFHCVISYRMFYILDSEDKCVEE